MKTKDLTNQNRLSRLEHVAQRSSSLSMDNKTTFISGNVEVTDLTSVYLAITNKPRSSTTPLAKDCALGRSQPVQLETTEALKYNTKVTIHSMNDFFLIPDVTAIQCKPARIQKVFLKCLKFIERIQYNKHNPSNMFSTSNVAYASDPLQIDYTGSINHTFRVNATSESPHENTELTNNKVLHPFHSSLSLNYLRLSSRAHIRTVHNAATGLFKSRLLFAESPNEVEIWPTINVCVDSSRPVTKGGTNIPEIEYLQLKHTQEFRELLPIVSEALNAILNRHYELSLDLFNHVQSNIAKFKHRRHDYLATSGKNNVSPQGSATGDSKVNITTWLKSKIKHKWFLRNVSVKHYGISGTLITYVKYDSINYNNKMNFNVIINHLNARVYSIFKTSSVPEISLHNYISRICEFTYISPAVLVGGLVIFDRYISSYTNSIVNYFKLRSSALLDLIDWDYTLSDESHSLPDHSLSEIEIYQLLTECPSFTLSPNTIYKLIFACIRIASKAIDLKVLTNRHFAAVGGIQTGQLNDLENLVLLHLSFNVLITPSEFNCYKDYIMENY